MIETILTTQNPPVAALAQSWLESGATSFEIWASDRRLASWPPDAFSPQSSLRVEIRLDKQPVGELRVSGLDSSTALARLQAEASLLSMSMEWARLKREMELAQQVHFNLLPKKLPRVPGLEIGAISRLASLVGGDFYDFIPTDSRSFNFAVGDISGKGVPSSLLMAMTRTIIRMEAGVRPAPTPETILLRTNAKLYEDFTGSGMFATVFIGQYHPRNHELRYVNAGHSPVIYRPAHGRAGQLIADGTALGVLPVSQSKNQCLKLHVGDLLLVGTDGLIEARNANQQFCYGRLLELIDLAAGLPAQEIAEFLFRSIEEFSARNTPEDDQTLVVLKCT